MNGLTRKGDHKSHRRRQLQSAGIRVSEEERHSTLQHVRQAENESDKSDIRWLLSQSADDVLPTQHAILGRWLDWLEANPQRGMTFAHRQRLHKWCDFVRKRLAMRRDGKTVDPLTSFAPKRRRSLKTWKPSTRPAWMSDPSLLPKKPPSARTPDS